MKKILAKNIDNPVSGVSKDEKIRFIKRTFVSNVCADTLLEYFHGKLEWNIEDVVITIIT